MVCVEHHLAVVAHADHVIDLGPGAGSEGGTIVFAGAPKDLMKVEESQTGQYLASYA